MIDHLYCWQHLTANESQFLLLNLNNPTDSFTKAFTSFPIATNSSCNFYANSFSYPKQNTKEEPYIHSLNAKPNHPIGEPKSNYIVIHRVHRFSTVRSSSLHIIRYNTISMKGRNCCCAQPNPGLIGSNCKFRFTAKTSSIFQGLKSIRLCTKIRPIISQYHRYLA